MKVPSNPALRKPLHRTNLVRLLVIGALCVSGTPDVRAACKVSEERLCLQNGRFAIDVDWRDFGNGRGPGRVVPNSSNTAGTFWFFRFDNWELMIKIIDGCALNGHFWVFVAPLTNVEVEVNVYDTVAGREWTYFNPLGRKAETALDTSALPCSGDASALPLLGSGAHHGMQVSFEPLPPATQALADEMVEEAIDLGMDVARVTVDWADLEPVPGEYRLQALKSAVEQASSRGLRPFVLLAAVDSEGLVVPSDLLGAEEPPRFRDGLDFDSPTVVERFEALLQQVVPLLVEHGAWALSVGNEPDAHLELNPDSILALRRFLEGVRETVHAIDDRLAVGLTVTIGSLLEPDGFGRDLASVMDVVPTNFYCLNGDLTFRGPLEETIASDLDGLLDAIDGKPLVLQELGCPSGRTGGASAIGVTQTDSTEFFDRIYPLIAERPRIRASFVFQLVDWSEELTNLFADDLRQVPGLEDFAERFAEWLETTGLMTFGPPAVIKPSWSEFLEAFGEE